VIKCIQSIRELFDQAFASAFGDGVPVDEFLEITRSTQPQFGHYQCNSAMKMAKALQQSPRDIATRIVEAIPQNNIIQKSDIAGPGFINIHLSSAAITRWVTELEQLDFANIKPEQKQKVVLDFSCPNTAKEMHVGHLRSTIIGDCLSRMYEFMGHDVLRLNHIGDWGTAFGMLITYIKEFEPEVFTTPSKVDLTFLVACYKKSKQVFDEDPEFKKRSQLEVVALQGGNKDTLKAWEAICEISRRAYEEIYNILDVNLTERGESFYNPLLKPLIDNLKQKGALEESDGAKVMFLDGFVNRDGDPLPLILQKSDGGFNYATTDLAALKHRVEQEHADTILYVNDAGQSTHMHMVYKAAQKAGFYNPSKVRVEHVPFGLVLGPDGKKFKTRSGDTERLIDLLNIAVDKAENILLERVNSDQSNVEQENIESTAKALGIGAVKYADLSCNRTHDYAFSYDKMLKFEGNTAAFMMYSYVRVQGIKRNCDDNVVIGPLKLEHESELALGFLLAQFFDVLTNLEKTLMPNILCDYLFDVAQAFNGFFRDCRVVGADEQASRLGLCEATAKVLKQGLDLLGVHVVERM
jgi:arginyl-tRNA synthetase